MNKKNKHISISFIGPSLLYGGAERWIYNLIKFCRPDQFKWLANIIQYPIVESKMLNLISNIVPTFYNNKVIYKDRIYNSTLIDEINNACEKSDIIIGWELDDILIKLINKHNNKLINVLHRNDPSLINSIKSEQFLCAVSPYWKNKLKGRLIKIIPNGIDFKRCTPRITRKEIRKRWHVNYDEYALGFIGRISKEKNCPAISRAISKDNNLLKGIFYGSHMEDSDYIINTMKEQTNNVLFFDPVENIGNILIGFDVLIIPSYTEACPLILLEGMFSKTPIVTTSNPLIDELESKHGKLVERINPEDSGEKILLAVRNALTIKEHKLNLAREIISNEFNIKIFTQNWERYLSFVYHQIENKSLN